MLEVSPLFGLADDLREFVRTHPGQFAGRLREFGGELYHRTFQQADLGLDELLVAAEPRRFCLSVPTGLDRLPWELLYFPSLKLFLGLNPHHSLVRLVRPPGNRDSFVGSVEPPLRILAFLGRPEGSPRLKEEEELLGRIAPSDNITMEILSGERATLVELEAAVRIQQPHVLRFSGARDDSFVLFSDTKMAIPAFIDWLGKSRVRLLDLTGCYVPVGGTASSVVLGSDLVKGGVPMVINTTSAITSEAVLVFTRDFYRTLAEGRSIDQALVEARQSQSKERWDWSAFALFTSEPSLGDLRAAAEPWPSVTSSITSSDESKG